VSDSFYDELDALTARHRQAEADSQRDKDTEERFQRIEGGIEKLGKLLEDRLPENSSAPNDPKSGDKEKGEEDPSASGDPPPTTPVEEELEVERIAKFSVPRIYTGDDEPEIVKYIDADTGEEKTRKGRRKNRPTSYDVEVVLEDQTIEQEQIPTEPDEQTA